MKIYSVKIRVLLSAMVLVLMNGCGGQRESEMSVPGWEIVLEGNPFNRPSRNEEDFRKAFLDSIRAKSTKGMSDYLPSLADLYFIDLKVQSLKGRSGAFILTPLELLYVELDGMIPDEKSAGFRRDLIRRYGPLRAEMIRNLKSDFNQMARRIEAMRVDVDSLSVVSPIEKRGELLINGSNMSGLSVSFTISINQFEGGFLVAPLSIEDKGSALNKDIIKIARGLIGRGYCIENPYADISAWDSELRKRFMDFLNGNPLSKIQIATQLSLSLKKYHHASVWRIRSDADDPKSGFFEFVFEGDYLAHASWEN